MSTTTEQGRDAARKLLGGDWDAGGTQSVNLPSDLARKLLEARGWRKSGGRWYTPEGNTYYWELAEALRVELVGEALSLPSDGTPPTTAEPRPWHESLNPAQLCITSGPTTLRDPDTDEWRVELAYSLHGAEHKVGGEDVTEKAAVLRMLDSLKTSVEARHPDTLDDAEGQGRR